MTLGNRSRGLVRDTIVQASAQYVGAATQLVKGIVLARLLGPSNLGALAVIGVFLAYGAYADLGLGYAAQREIPIAEGAGDDDRSRGLHGSALFARILGDTLVAVVLYWWLLTSGSSDAVVRFGLATAGVVLLLQGLTVTQQFVLQARRRFKAAAAVSLVVSVGSLILGVLGAWAWGIRGVFVSQAVSYALSFITATALAGVPRRLPFSLPEYRKLVAGGLSLALLAFVGYNLVYVDQLMILGLLGQRALGLYSVVLYAGSAISMLPAALAATVGPRLLRRYGETPNISAISEMTWRPVAVISTYLTPVVASAWVIAPLLVGFFLPAYVSSVAPLRIYVAGVYFLGVNLGVSTTLMAVNKYRVNIPILAGCVVFNAAIDYVLVRYFALGLDGIAAGSAVTYVLYWIVHTGYVRSLFGSRCVEALRDSLRSAWPGVAVLVLTAGAGFTGQLGHSGLFDWCVAIVAVVSVLVRRLGSSDGLASRALGMGESDA